MIERERPHRRPLLPRWVLPGVGGAFVLLIAVWAAIALLDASARVEVPDIVGISEEVAAVRATQLGLELRVAERPFDPSEAGTILAQDPPAGSSLRKGESIRITVSAGTEEATMPDVVGQSIQLARARLEALGLVIKIDAVESDAPTDTVLATNPSPGATVRTSDIVRVTVASSGRATPALLPYRLDGQTFLLDPSPVETGTVDVPLEIARRLRSLLEASGAQVTVTRSLVSADTSDASRSAAGAGAVSAAIGLEITVSGPGGVVILTPAREGGATAYQASVLLAETLSARLQEAGTASTRESSSNDAVLRAVTSPSARIRLGSTANPQDSASFRDPAWSDTIARAIYRALGERFGSQ